MIAYAGVMQMEQGEPHVRKQSKTMPQNWPGALFAEMGEQRLEALTEMQKQFLHAMEEMNRNWVMRAKSEADLASEFMTKLTAAHSIPEAAKVYQEWLTREMNMLAEDGRRLFTESQKLTETTTRLLTSGWPSGGTH
jgi:hypothetical protein